MDNIPDDNIEDPNAPILPCTFATQKDTICQLRTILMTLSSPSVVDHVMSFIRSYPPSMPLEDAWMGS